MAQVYSEKLVRSKNTLTRAGPGKVTANIPSPVVQEFAELDHDEDWTDGSEIVVDPDIAARKEQERLARIALREEKARQRLERIKSRKSVSEGSNVQAVQTLQEPIVDQTPQTAEFSSAKLLSPELKSEVLESPDLKSSLESPRGETDEADGWGNDW